MLKQHNIIRRNHNAQELTWDTTLAYTAQLTADYQYRTDDYIHTHVFASDNPKQEFLCHEGKMWNTQTWTAGENLYKRWHPWGTTIDQIYWGWYTNEIGKYTTGEFSLGSGHFTQLVWKATTRVGCAFRGKAQPIYIVCHYEKHGNVKGRFEENVQQRPTKTLTYIKMA